MERLDTITLLVAFFGGLTGLIVLLSTRFSKLHRLLLFIVGYFIVMQFTTLLVVRDSMLLLRWPLLGAVCLYLIFQFLSGRVNIRLDIYTLLFFILLILAFISSIYSMKPSVSFFKSLTLLMLFIISFLGMRGFILKNEEGTKNILNGYAFIALILFGSIAVFYVVYPGLVTKGRLLVGYFWSSKWMGGMIISFIPFLFLRYLNPWEKRRSRLYLAMFVVALGMVLITFARSAIAGVVISMGIFQLIYNRRYFPLYLFMLAGFYLFVFVAGLYNINLVSSSPTLERYVYKDRRETLMDPIRRMAQETTLEYFKKSPVFGVGFGISAEVEQDDFLERGFLHKREKGNSYLAILEELGLMGFGTLMIMFLVFLLRTYGTLRKAMKHLPRDDPDFLMYLALFSNVIGLLLGAVMENWLLSVGNVMCIVFWYNFVLTIYLMQRIQYRIQHPEAEEVEETLPVKGELEPPGRNRRPDSIYGLPGT